MYAGKKVEEADVIDLFDRPLHPYTRALMASMPSMNTASTRLAEIPGLVPAAHELGRGCAFAARCSHARERCRNETPQLTQQGGDHVVACFAVEEQWADAGEVTA
jgi:peptide/nickel transport system ATP-binding protein